MPVPLLIGNHQYAYIIRNFNGGPGGPFWLDNYLITEVGNSYRKFWLPLPVAVGTADGISVVGTAPIMRSRVKNRHSGILSLFVKAIISRPTKKACPKGLRRR
jgi:hypothetical protein